MHELIVFGDRRLLEDGDGRLYLRVEEERPRELDPERPLGLLPLLEAGRAAYADAALARLPLRAVLLLALSSGDYWAALALESWLTPRDLQDAGVREAVLALAADERRPRLVRHGAHRLLDGAS